MAPEQEMAEAASKRKADMYLGEPAGKASGGHGRADRSLCETQMQELARAMNTG